MENSTEGCAIIAPNPDLALIKNEMTDTNEVCPLVNMMMLYDLQCWVSEITSCSSNDAVKTEL